MDELNPELYKRLFEYIENGCKQHNIERDCVKYLISMEQAESIEQLIKIYNNIYKLLAIIFYGGENVPYDWYKHEYWGYEPHEMVEELTQYLNENILKWVKRLDYLKKVHYSLSIINLRECQNTEYIQETILNLAGDGAPDNIKTLAAWRQHHHISLLEFNKRGRRQGNTLCDYMHYSKLLVANGRIFDVIEEAFAKQNNIDYNDLLVQYRKELEEREIKRKEEEERKAEEEENIKQKNFFSAFIIITLLVIFLVIISKIGFFGIIIIIGLIGLLPKIFLTGKI